MLCLTFYSAEGERIRYQNERKRGGENEFLGAGLMACIPYRRLYLFYHELAFTVAITFFF